MKMINKHNIIFLAIIIFFFSCNNDYHEEKELLLCSNISKCWNLLEEGSIKYIPKGRHYCFYKNNKFLVFYYDKQNNKIEYDYGDQAFTNEWIFKNDSILVMSGFDNKIIKLTKDSLIIINPEKILMKLIPG